MSKDMFVGLEGDFKLPIGVGVYGCLSRNVQPCNELATQRCSLPLTQSQLG